MTSKILQAQHKNQVINSSRVAQGHGTIGTLALNPHHTDTGIDSGANGHGSGLEGMAKRTIMSGIVRRQPLGPNGANTGNIHDNNETAATIATSPTN